MPDKRRFSTRTFWFSDRRGAHPVTPCQNMKRLRSDAFALLERGSAASGQQDCSQPRDLRSPFLRQDHALVAASTSLLDWAVS